MPQFNVSVLLVLYSAIESLHHILQHSGTSRFTPDAAALWGGYHMAAEMILGQVHAKLVS